MGHFSTSDAYRSIYLNQYLQLCSIFLFLHRACFFMFTGYPLIWLKVPNYNIAIQVHILLKILSQQTKRKSRSLKFGKFCVHILHFVREIQWSIYFLSSLNQLLMKMRSLEYESKETKLKCKMLNYRTLNINQLNSKD